MKRLTAITVVIALALCSLLLVPSATVQAAEKAPILFMNGNVVLGASPVIVNGTTLVPFRAVAELTGATVTWDDARQMAVATFGSKTITLPVVTPPAATPTDERTFVPLRFIADTFGLTVTWNEDHAFILLESAAGKGSSQVILDAMTSLASEGSAVRDGLGRSFVDMKTGERLWLVSLQRETLFPGGAKLVFRKANGETVAATDYFGTLYGELWPMRSETYDQWTALLGQSVWAWTANSSDWLVTLENLEEVWIAKVEVTGNVEVPLKVSFEAQSGTNSLGIRASSTKTTPWFELNEQSSYMLTKDPHQQHPDWSDKVWDSIRQERVFIGMTEDQAYLARGAYKWRNQTTAGSSTHVQWVYDGQYLHFDDGVLTAIQN